MASTYIQRTFSGAGNRKTWTMSAWIKRTALASSSDIRVWGWKSGGGNYGFQFDSDKFRFYLVAGGSGSEFLTNRTFRDINAWYHIVAKCDTTQSTASDRFKLYVNGVQETSFATATYPNQDEDTAVNQAEICRLGCNAVATNSFFDGLISHVHFTDGYAYDASTFGSTDAATGEWNINTSPSITMGTNGFTILKDGNTITDQSANSNDFSLGAGSVTKSEDNPSNVFATWSPLMAKANINLIHGNTSIRPQANSIDFQTASTLAFKTGKFYAEFKYLENDGHQMYGISTTEGAMELKRNTQFPGQTTTSVAMYASNGSIYENNSATSYGSGWGNNTIIMMAVDADNNKIYFGNNGTWYNSGNPSTGANGYSFNATNLAGFKYMVAGNGTVGYDNTDANFGNGYIGTTAVSSAGNNASGNGIFEYDVPTGYTALCTKGLNT